MYWTGHGLDGVEYVYVENSINKVAIEIGLYSYDI